MLYSKLSTLLFQYTSIVNIYCLQFHKRNTRKTQYNKNITTLVILGEYNLSVRTKIIEH